MIRQQFSPALATTAAFLTALLAIAAPQARAADSHPQTVDKSYLLEKAPEHPSDVAAARKDVKDQQDVVVVGRVGGRKSPWVKGTAAFSIVDRSLKACNE